MLQPTTTAPTGVVVFLATVFAIGASASLSQAQDLSDLWPNGDGTKWTYEFTGWERGSDPLTISRTWNVEATLTLAGTENTAGGIAQKLVGWHAAISGKPGPQMNALLTNLWRARPDLRDAIRDYVSNHPNEVASSANWLPNLLHDGLFMKLPNKIEMWQASWDHSTWTYLTDALSVGQKFTHQLVPELADNVFLHGTVGAVDATITTPAGTYANAVKVLYEIDYGVTDMTDETGTKFGTIQTLTLGHVYYVPHVGPVDSSEEWIPYAVVDCSPLQCPLEVLDRVGVAWYQYNLSLQSGPVGVKERPWSFVMKL